MSSSSSSSSSESDDDNQMQVEQEESQEEKKAPVVQDTPHTGLAKKLAHNNVRVRTQALEAVRVFLTKSPDLMKNETAMPKLWMGLYYCMWFSDKPLVQQDMAEKLAQLMLPLPVDRALKFLNAGCDVLLRHWAGIDRLRIDKFMTLVRCLLRASLVYLRNHGWEASLVRQWGNIMLYNIVSDEEITLARNNQVESIGFLSPCTLKNRGLCFHTLDLLCDELEAVMVEATEEKTATYEMLQQVLQPLYVMCALERDSTVVKRVRKTLGGCLDNIAGTISELITDAESANPEDCVYPALTSIFSTHGQEQSDALLALASDPLCSSKGRKALYSMRQAWINLAAQEVQLAAAVATEKDSTKKSKKDKKTSSKKRKVAVVATQEAKEEEKKEMVTPVKKPKKKQKKSSKKAVAPAVVENKEEKGEEQVEAMEVEHVTTPVQPKQKKDKKKKKVAATPQPRKASKAATAADGKKMTASARKVSWSQSNDIAKFDKHTPPTVLRRSRRAAAAAASSSDGVAKPLKPLLKTPTKKR